LRMIWISFAGSGIAYPRAEIKGVSLSAISSTGKVFR
jgi:hypothetical protein